MIVRPPVPSASPDTLTGDKGLQVQIYVIVPTIIHYRTPNVAHSDRIGLLINFFWQ